MSEPHVYGRSIVQPIRVFGDAKVPIPVAGLVSARLYATAPTGAQRNDHAEALGGFVDSVNEFSSTDEEALLYTVTFDALADPNLESTALYDVWHVVANVELEEDGQPQPVYREILVWRPTAQFSHASVVPDDVYAIEHDVEKRLGDTKVKAKIVVALDRVLERLHARDFDRNKLRESDLRLSVVYLAASLCLRDMSTQQNANYWAKAEHYESQYEKIWNALKVGYAGSDTGAIRPEDRVKPGIRGMQMRI